MRTRTRIHPYVLPEIARRLASYCGAKGTTESAVVEEAISQYLDAGEKDNELILRRLDRIGRASTRHQRVLEVLSEAFGVFVHRWVATLPELAGADRDTVNRLSDKRYQTFLRILTGNLARGTRLLSTDGIADAANGPEKSAPVNAPTER